MKEFDAPPPKSKPISPNEARKQKLSQIPPEAFDVINKMILEKCRGGGKHDFILYANDIATKLSHIRGYEDSWLDFEPFYRDAGWKVEFVIGHYSDNVRNHYIFTEN